MSTLKVTNIQATGETASRAVSGVAAAWVNFNGTGTIASRDSVNVASLTDNGTGQYSINFSNAMSNANYAAVTSGGSSGVAAGMGYMYSPSTTSTGVEFVNASDNLMDPVYATSAIHGDLA